MENVASIDGNNLCKFTQVLSLIVHNPTFLYGKELAFGHCCHILQAASRKNKWFCILHGFGGESSLYIMSP